MTETGRAAPPPQGRKTGLLILAAVLLVVVVIAAAISFGRVASVDTSGPIEQGAANLTTPQTAQENYEAVTAEAPPAGPGVEQSANTTAGDPGHNP